MSYYNGRPGIWSMMTPVVKNLIIINIIVAIGTWLVGDSMYNRFSLFAFESPYFKPYQIVTYMFMHGGFWHIFFNMYTLMIFGIALERVWGSKRFILFYLVCGIGAGLCHDLILHFQISGFLASEQMAAAYRLMGVPTVGASGAIYGILLGYGMLYPNNILQLIFPPIALKAKWFVVIFAAIELVTGLLGTHDGVAHFAHLGGMLFGLILILIWKKDNRLYY